MELVQASLGGRRGLRLLLEFAIESEAILLGENADRPLNLAAFLASYQADPGRGESVVLGAGADSAPATPWSRPGTSRSCWLPPN